ncbi:MAG: M20/M25/M40 family metallo-hydrolase [Thermoanaerobaculia bacterium]|nr:M20/M25/M40 family metallo-hydrolase [Thermoanaerobaculia bacterium]
MTPQPPIPQDVSRKAVSLLKDLCAVSSPSGDAAGLRKAADQLGRALERRGLEVTIADELDGHGQRLPVLRARGPIVDQPGTVPLLAVGHLDTVLAAEPPRVENDLMRGTGSVDMKGGLAAMVGALDLLRARGQSQAARDLLLVVVPDEEVIGRLTREVMEMHGPQARAVWVLEPGSPREVSEDETPPVETLVIGRRGRFQWQTDVHGRSAHAGNGYWHGRSAATAATRWWLECESLARPGRGPTINAGRLVAGEADFVDDIERHADLLGSPRQINVVPNRARVEGEARFLAVADGEQVAAAMETTANRIAEQTETLFDFRTDSWVRPMVPGVAGRRWATLARDLAHQAGWSLETEEDRPGISFSNFLPDAGSIPVLDGLGPVGGGMHTRDEFVDLRSLDRRIVLLADLLEATSGSC